MATHGQTVVSAVPSGGERKTRSFSHASIGTHINTTEISLFDTGVGQEGIDESHIHTNTLENLYKKGYDKHS